MINDPNMINKLIEKINKIPDEVIRNAIKEIEEEDEKEYFKSLSKLVEDYEINEKYYYEPQYNIYIHIGGTSHNKKDRNLCIDEKKEVMVA